MPTLSQEFQLKLRHWGPACLLAYFASHSGASSCGWRLHQKAAVRVPQDQPPALHCPFSGSGGHWGTQVSFRTMWFVPLFLTSGTGTGPRMVFPMVFSWCFSNIMTDTWHHDLP